MKRSNFLKKIQNFLNSSLRTFRSLSKQSPILFEKIELTVMFFFASIVFFYLVNNSLGYLPEPIYGIFPFLHDLLTYPPIRFFASPEQTYFLYMLSLDFFINRNILGFSLLVKYHLLLIFILEMVENLVLTLWDFFTIRELELFIHAGMPIRNESANFFFFLMFFIFFFSLYVYSYLKSLKGEFTVFPSYLKPLTDCVRFWLQMKDPKR